MVKSFAMDDSTAAVRLFEKLGDLSTQEIQTVRQLLAESVPGWLTWAAHLIARFL